LRERDSQIVYSQASLPPRVSIFGNSQKVEEITRRLGAEGFEMLPTWGIWREARLYGLLLSDDLLSSFHQSWRIDALLERRCGIRKPLVNRILNIVMFPPQSWTNQVMRKLWEYYNVPRFNIPPVPTVIHAVVPETTLGKEDKYAFFLELAHQNDKDLGSVLGWVGEKPKIRGIVFPTRDDQLREWQTRYATDFTGFSWNQIARELRSYIKSVHLGPLSIEEILKMCDSDSSLTQTEERLKYIYELGFKGSAVIEVDPRKFLFAAKEMGKKPDSVYQKVAERFKKLRDVNSK